MLNANSIVYIINFLIANFVYFLAYCRGLKFTEKPDYSFLLKLLNEILENNNLKNDFCFDWKIVNSQTSLDIAVEKDKDSETTKIIEKKTKDLHELKNIFDNSALSADETVAYSPQNIKYCKSFLKFKFFLIKFFIVFFFQINFV